jgi:hypothetical protein
MLYNELQLVFFSAIVERRSCQGSWPCQSVASTAPLYYPVLEKYASSSMSSRTVGDQLPTYAAEHPGTLEDVNHDISDEVITLHNATITRRTRKTNNLLFQRHEPLQLDTWNLGVINATADCVRNTVCISTITTAMMWNCWKSITQI